MLTPAAARALSSNPTPAKPAAAIIKECKNIKPESGKSVSLHTRMEQVRQMQARRQTPK
jgi:hypothetical protein